ncbi:MULTISPECIES: class I SAM-dependent methyltransferase [Actinosynnema]|uniref:class I SAM-dependent DNA methyltransferase n=1 Tax=Actinosynnema TaxID=40566 RepID=UPI0020A41F9F|nr:class I SAM-dependent methyltransferase [Actinosynnema pretiosum]MCP2099976.1 Methyltransferase domain-containing protein [Actinosynnema pretiosum]
MIDPRSQATRASYDTVAESYDRLVRSSLPEMPFDRALLAVFAELVDGPVLEVGCGTGRITAHLGGLGVEISGVDLSPGMVEVARREHPGHRFEVGAMQDLAVPDGALGGVVAWYSTVHTPTADLLATFTELARVLAPGGHLLTAFKAGDRVTPLRHAYGHDVDLEVHWHPVDAVADAITGAGLTEVARLVRAPHGPEKGPQGGLIARKA